MSLRRLAAGGALLVLAGCGASVAGEAPASPAALSSPASPVAPQAVNLPLLPAFARSGRVELRLIAEEVKAVAFHEASLLGALEMRPLGRCKVCGNAPKFTPPPAVDPALRYMVMDSRGRDFPATSAVDVVLPDTREVMSPVTGVVAEVKPYRLYDKYPDMRVAIAPAGAPGRHVVMIHLGRVVVRPGDEVVASLSPIGRVRAFPFESHVDRYTGGRFPHVHIEVKDLAARPPPA